MQEKESSMERNMKQASQVESFSEDIQAVSISVSAIESKIVLKEKGKNRNVNIKEDQIMEFPKEMSIIVNNIDAANINRGDQLNSLSQKEPVVGVRLDDAEDEEKNGNLQRRVHDDNLDKSFSEDILGKSLNISSQLSQYDFEDGGNTIDLQKQVD